VKDRIDMGVKIAGQKAELPDEFVTKSQLVTPDGNALETLANGDLVVPAATSDHLVLVDELDTNPGTLLDKIYPAGDNVTISVVEIDGERVMEIGVEDSGGLPSGTENQTLRHNGTDWEACSELQVGKSQYFEDFYVTNGSSSQLEIYRTDINNKEYGGYISINAQSGSNGDSDYSTVQLNASQQSDYNYGTSNISLHQGSSPSLGGSYIQLYVQQSLPESTTGAGLKIDGVIGAVEIDCASMSATYLAGTGNRPLYADSSGNINAQTGYTGDVTISGITLHIVNGIIEDVT